MLVKINMLRFLAADINMFMDIYNERFNTRLPQWPGTKSKQGMIANKLLELAVQNKSAVVFVHFFKEEFGICERITELEASHPELGIFLGFEIYHLNGTMSATEREVEIKASRNAVAENRRCLLFATIQSSSEGFNLQHFNHAVFSTADWNPANEEQAKIRFQRIGQHKQVFTYRFFHKYQELIGGETTHIDSMILEKQQIKSDIAKTIDSYPNAAHFHPVRDIDGFEGEKSVIWR